MWKTEFAILLNKGYISQENQAILELKPQSGQRQSFAVMNEKLQNEISMELQENKNVFYPWIT